jgi:hypothetical protein
VRVPDDDASALEWMTFEQAGLVTWAQATSVLTPAKVRHLLASGRWLRLCRGVFHTQPGPLTPDQRHWLAVLAAGDGAVLAGLAAALAGGLRGSWRYEAVDVLVPYGRHPADLLRRLPPDLPTVQVRRTRVLPDEHVQVGRPTRTTMARSIVDAAGWVRTDADAQAIVAAGCQQGRVTPAELLRVLDQLPVARRRALVRDTARDAEGGATALSEVDLVKVCRRYRLPVPDLQEPRTDASGRTRYLDAYWRRWKLHAEVDGAHHMNVAHRGGGPAPTKRGDRIVRFPAWLVRRKPGEVAAQLRAALVAAGWTPKL